MFLFDDVIVWWHTFLKRPLPSKFAAWWRHQMETISALLAICAGNSLVPGEFPAQWPVTWSFDVFFDLRLNKRFSINGEAGDFRRYRAHYAVTVMESANHEMDLECFDFIGHLWERNRAHKDFKSYSSSLLLKSLYNTHFRIGLYTVKCRYRAVQFIAILHTAMHWEQQNINKNWNSHNWHPIPRPNGWTMGRLLWEKLGKLTAL